MRKEKAMRIHVRLPTGEWACVSVKHQWVAGQAVLPGDCKS